LIVTILILSMDQLPAVLQKEIWEYVRGDRAHWRERVRQSMVEFKARVWREEHWHYDDCWDCLPMNHRLLATLTNRHWPLLYRTCEPDPVVFAGDAKSYLACTEQACQYKIRCDHEIKRSNFPPKDEWTTNLIQLFKHRPEWKDRFADTLTPKEVALLAMLAPTCMR
jgi:hypothetical protein